MTKMRVLTPLTLILMTATAPAVDSLHTKEIWKIGEADNSIKDLALEPGEYAEFLNHDFGWEDRFYLIGSPIFPKVTIDLGERYGRGKTFTIEAKDVSHVNKYIESAMLNGKLTHCMFPAKELLKGGSLVLQMGPKLNKQWGGIAPERQINN